MTRELWGYDELARYAKLARSYVANSVVVMPGFPRPIKLGPKSHPRWVSQEVMEWFEQHRGEG